MVQVEQQIVSQHEDINDLLHKFSGEVRRLTSEDLRYGSTGMRHHMLESHINAFESKFGELKLVTKDTRKTSQCLGTIIQRMNKRDYI